MWGGVVIFYPLISGVASFLWFAIMAIALNVGDASAMQYDREMLVTALFTTTWIVVLVAMLIARKISEYEFIWWQP